MYGFKKHRVVKCNIVDLEYKAKTEGSQTLSNRS
jgi:hypothetical protein